MRSTTSLLAQTFSWQFKTTKWLAAFLLDMQYTIAGTIASGENAAGYIKELILERKGDNVPMCYAERDTIVDLLTWRAGQNVDGFLNMSMYSNNTPATTVTENSFFTVIGPWPPGTYTITLKTQNVTDEWPLASTFNLNVAPGIFECAKPWVAPGYITAKRIYQQTEFKVNACHQLYLSNLNNLKSVQMGGRILSSTEVRHFMGWWSIIRGGAWAFDFTTQQMEVVSAKATPGAVFYTSNQDVTVCSNLFMKKHADMQPEMYELGPRGLASGFAQRI